MHERLLIIGGTGFIGSHLAKKAMELGFETIVLSTKRPSIDREISGVTYLEANIVDPLQLEKKLTKYSFHYVVNLSGYIDHSSFLTGGSDVLEQHFFGLKNLLEVIDWSVLKRFVQIGSSDEYGNQPAPQNEKMPAAPISSYSLGKSASTHLLQMLCQTEAFPATILRLFLVYGPGQGEKRFLPQVISGCLSDKDFPVSSGEQFRDFSYVEDVITAILLCFTNDEVNGEIINIGSGVPVSIRDMVEYVRATIGMGHPQFGAFPYRSKENMALYADTTKAKDLLGWVETVSFKDGMKATIEYYRGVWA